MQDNVVEIFKALSSEQRLKIIKHLLETNQYKCYCELTNIIKKDKSVIYRHFQNLQNAGIIETRKRGKKLKGHIKNPEKIRKILKIAEEIKNES